MGLQAAVSHTLRKERPGWRVEIKPMSAGRESLPCGRDDRFATSRIFTVIGRRSSRCSCKRSIGSFCEEQTFRVLGHDDRLWVDCRHGSDRAANGDLASVSANVLVVCEHVQPQPCSRSTACIERLTGTASPPVSVNSALPSCRLSALAAARATHQLRCTRAPAA